MPTKKIVSKNHVKWKKNRTSKHAKLFDLVLSDDTDAKEVSLKPSLVKNCCSQQFCLRWYNLSA